MLGECWGMFHDGTIEAIEGTLPGTITVAISIPYLRARFPGQGDGFTLRLDGCTRFEYAEYDCAPVSDLPAIAGAGPEIVAVRQTEDPVVLDCVMGTLTMAYATASISTDTGQAISPAELEAASKAYWDVWAARHTQA